MCVHIYICYICICVYIYKVTFSEAEDYSAAVCSWPQKLQKAFWFHEKTKQNRYSKSYSSFNYDQPAMFWGGNELTKQFSIVFTGKPTPKFSQSWNTRMLTISQSTLQLSGSLSSQIHVRLALKRAVITFCSQDNVSNFSFYLTIGTANLKVINKPTTVHSPITHTSLYVNRLTRKKTFWDLSKSEDT